MLQEGERQKIETQESGEFINYDLIDVKRYSLGQACEVLGKGREEVMLGLYKEGGMEEVQVIKDLKKIEKLEQGNYKMLEMMFQLPQQYQLIEEENQQKNDMMDRQMEEMQMEQQQQQQNINVNMNQELLEPNKISSIQNKVQNKINSDQEIIQQFQIHQNQPQQQLQLLQQLQVSENVRVMELNSDRQKEKNQNMLLVKPQEVEDFGKFNVTPEKQSEKSKSKEKSKKRSKEKSKEKEPISQLVGGICFVEIKKKKREKKKPAAIEQKKNISLTEQKAQFVIDQKKSNIIESTFPTIIEPNQHIIINPQQQQQLHESKNNNSGKVASQAPQKRKYIRKKPLQPRKSKSQMQRQKVQNQEDNSIRLQIMLPQQVIQSTLQQNIQPIQTIQLQQINKQQQPLLFVQGQKRTVQIPQTLKQSIATLPKKTKKTKKAQPNLSSQQQQQRHGKKTMKQLQIMLPYAGCEEQVNELKKQIQELNMKIQNEKIEFLQNQKHALTILGMVQNIDIEKKEITTEKTSKVLAEKLQKIKLQNQPRPQQNKQYLSQQYSVNNQKQPPITTVAIQNNQINLKDDISKKPKPIPRQSLTKKQSKKSSSEEYKPAQDQLQSISQLQQIGNPLSELYDGDKKEKKTKKKHGTKKKVNKEVTGGMVQKARQSNLIKKDEVIALTEDVKQKRLKLTVEQREKNKVEKQKLKEMRVKEKEERKKLRQLEKLQKQGLKLRKSQTSNKDSSKQRNNSISVNDNSSGFIMIVSEERKETSPQKKQTLHQVINENQSQVEGKEHKKSSLQESIGNNSTKEDIRTNSMSVDKSHIHCDLGQILESEKQVNHQNDELIDFVTIRPEMIVEQNKQKVAGYQNSIEESSGYSGPKRDCPAGQQQKDNNGNIHDNQHQGSSLPKKKIKLTCKHSQQYKDPQYGLTPDVHFQQTYTIQVFQPTQIIEQKHESVDDKPQENKEQVNFQFIEQGASSHDGESNHSSSLSAEDE